MTLQWYAEMSKNRYLPFAWMWQTRDTPKPRGSVSHYQGCYRKAQVKKGDAGVAREEYFPWGSGEISFYWKQRNSTVVFLLETIATVPPMGEWADECLLHLTLPIFLPLSSFLSLFFFYIINLSLAFFFCSCSLFCKNDLMNATGFMVSAWSSTL